MQRCAVLRTRCLSGGRLGGMYVHDHTELNALAFAREKYPSFVHLGFVSEKKWRQRHASMISPSALECRTKRISMSIQRERHTLLPSTLHVCVSVCKDEACPYELAQCSGILSGCWMIQFLAVFSLSGGLSCAICMSLKQELSRSLF